MGNNWVPSGTTEKQLKAARDEAAQPKPEPEEYKGPVYKTELVNKRDAGVPVCENGKIMFNLVAKGEYFLESWSPHTNFAPFSRVIFEKDGRISSTRRHGFLDTLAAEPWTILLDNRDGASSETLMIGGNFVEVLQGLPKRIPVAIDAAEIIYKAIIWKRRVVKTSIPGARDYLTTRSIVERVMVPRKKSEIVKIRKLLVEEAAKLARRDAERRFHGVVGGPEEEVPSADESEVQSPNVKT